MPKGEDNSCERGSVITIGTFDGVHRGHQKVLKVVREYGEKRGLQPVAITFDRHPLEIIAPERAPKLLQDMDERDRLISAQGVKSVRTSFTRELARLSAGEWLRELKRKYGMRALVLGYDNRFGRDGRELSADDYKALARREGVDLEVVSELGGVSSSQIRRLLTAGEIEEASELLGRPYTIEGEVVKGRGLGHTIGYPTANISVPDYLQLPECGVYAGKTDLGPAVVNIGNNPTVGAGNAVTVEAYLPGFSGNIYGRKLKIELKKRIRPERKFGSMEELKEQIASDVREAMKIDFGN